MVKHEQSQRRSPWWQVLQGIAIFFILFVLAFSIDVFSLSIYPLSSSSFKLNEPFTLFHLGEERPVNPTALSEYDEVYASTLRDIGAFSNLITIDLKQENLLIEFALTTPAEEMSEVLTQGLGGKEEHLLRVAFGQIEINGSALSENGLETATWTVDEKEGLITLYIRYFDEHYREGFTLRKTRLSGTQIAPQEEKVILHFDEFKLTEMVPLPYIATKTDAELIVDERNKNDFSVRLEALNPKRPVLGTVPPTQRTTEPTRQDIFQNISELISDIPLFSRVFYAFSELFPLVLFWLLIYRLDLSEDTHLYKVLDITKKILALHFMLYILGSMSSLYYDYEFSKDWIGTFEATLQKIFFTVPNPIFGNGMWRIGIVAFGLLFPTYLNMRENNKPSKISRFLNLTFYILLLALIVSLGVLIRNGLEEGSCSLSLSSGSFIKTFELFVNNTLPCSIHSSAWILFTAGLALLLMRFSLGLLWKLIVRKDSPLLLWGASLLLAGYLGFQVLLVRDNQSYKYSDKVFFAALLLLGFYLVLSLTRYLMRLWDKEILYTKYRKWLLPTLLIICVPFYIVTEDFWAPDIQIFSFTYRVDDLLIFVWIATILLFLYEDGKADIKLSSMSRMMGILVSATLIFGTTSRWFYIPITFLLGWFALGWLIDWKRDWEEIDAQFKEISNKRDELLRNIDRSRLAERAYQQYRDKAISELVTDEKTTIDTFQEKLDSWEKKNAPLLGVSDGKKRTNLSEQPLAFGFKETAWQNGLHGAKWAIIFALPWITIYLFDFLKETSFAPTYPFLDAGESILLILGKWISMGFMLGYFFPYIRGKSGLSKGLYLFLATVVPTLPLHFIYYTSSEAWYAFLFSVLQVFIHCLLLGLIAFDYMAVQKERRSFQLLLDIHGIRSIGIWLASLIAAIGTSAITIFSGQAITLVGLLLKALFPDAPTEGLSGP